MQVYFKGEPIKEVCSLEEGRAFAEKFQNEIFVKYNYFIEKSHLLIDLIDKIRPRELGESLEEYEDFVKSSYSDLFEDIDKLGRDFYGEDFIKTYFINSRDCLVGYLVFTKEGTKRKESIENLGLKACTHFAFNQLLEIK